MLTLNNLLTLLHYSDSIHYWNNQSKLDSATAHIFRVAYENANVRGIYVVNSSTKTNEHQVLPARPVVYLAEASTLQQAKEVHRTLWNLSFAPFIIIKLPNQIRIYTGFSYSQAENTNESGLLKVITEEELEQLQVLMIDFSAESIDSGQIWKSSYANELDLDYRVDQHLLKNLRQLGQALKQDGLQDDLTHALIGKYVYLSYLRDSNILTDEWLKQQRIDPESIFTLRANVESLQKLTEVLERKINGRVFPIDFNQERHQALLDRHVSWVASVFSGSDIIDSSAPGVIQQLYLPFQAYDFRYIPVETLSAIYEQFIDERKKIGAIYTPEFLADYLLSEVEWAKPLHPNGKLLNPACGSGIFLVLAMRRIVEKQMMNLGRRLSAEELKAVLANIYGIERERDACYVTEFSLILTFLNYVEPRELQQLEFKLPNLHNRQIFEMDFFDLKGENAEVNFWNWGLKFDWIVGNPPWTSKLDTERDKFALNWIQQSKSLVSGQRVAEAFSWLVLDVLGCQGVIGLLMPATSLVVLNSERYRQTFFAKNEVLRITNFANFRDILFGKGKASVLPAITIIYRHVKNPNSKPDIIHYGPFVVNQLSKTRPTLWTITINENEVKTVSADEAASGNFSVWKFALWGTFLDKDVIGRIRYLFPHSLDAVCQQNEWYLQQASELRNGNQKSTEKLEFIPELKGKKLFDTDLVTDSLFRFSLEPGILQKIPDEMCYIRVQGGKKGLDVTWEPHLIISPAWGHYVFYSDEDFILPARQIGISSFKHPNKHNSDHLKALSLYLRSSLVAYYVFFNVPEWGIFRQAKRVATTEVKKIPTPKLTRSQIQELVNLYESLVKREQQEVERCLMRVVPQASLVENTDNSLMFDTALSTLRRFSPSEKKRLDGIMQQPRLDFQKEIDNTIWQMFDIPEDIQTIVHEFMNIRLPLDVPSQRDSVTRRPTNSELLTYSRQLQDELESFSMGVSHYNVHLTHSDRLIECTIEKVQKGSKLRDDSIKSSDFIKTKMLNELSKELQSRLSQWVYIQQGLRLFNGPRIYLYKNPELINWTRTQAMLDCSDIIGEVISSLQNENENRYA